MSKEQFRAELYAQLARAKSQGRKSVEINAGELHRQVGGYPPKENEPSEIGLCCTVLRTELKKGSAEIVHEPPKGTGPALTIRYDIPRPVKQVTEAS